MISEHSKLLTVEELQMASAILKSVSHPIRLQIVDLLDKNSYLSVNEICYKISVEQSLTSHHLSKMRQSDILGTRKDGQRVFYYLKLKLLTNLLACMAHCMDNLKPQ